MLENVKDVYNRSKWSLALGGLFSLAIGILIIARPMASVAVLALVIALWALVDGCTALVRAIELRKVVKHWWALALAGVVGICFGIAALYYYPNLSLTFAILWLATWLIVAGILGVYVSILEKRIGGPWGWTLALGLLSAVVGFAALGNPGATLAAIMGLISGFAIVRGVVLLVEVARLESAEHEFHDHLHGGGMPHPAP